MEPSLRRFAVAYPDKLLAEDEKVVEHLHPHWITLVPATLWFIAIVGVDSYLISLVADHTDGTTQNALVIALIVVGFLLLCWLTFAPWLQWRTTHYVFTSHRVLIRRGILRRTGRDIALQRINDVGFTQSLWDRMVRAGTLTIESAGENGQEELKNIPRSDQQQQLLNRLIEEDHDRRARSYGVQQGYPPPGYQQQPPGYPTQQYPGQGPNPTQQYPQS
jgi:uncharacterized membrane protein YdbT with pleckstrin-like domain